MNSESQSVEASSKVNPPLSRKVFPSVYAILAFFLVLTISAPAFLSNQQPIRPVFYGLFLLPTIVGITTGWLNVPALFRRSPAVFFLVIPLLYWCSSVLWSGSPDEVYSFLRRALSLVVFITGVAFVASSNRIDLRSYLNIALFIVAIGAISQLVYTYIYLEKSASWRLGEQSTFGGPIHAAHYFGFFFVYGMVCFFQSRGRLRAAYLFSALACLAYILMAHSRGPYVAVICVSLLTFFINVREFRWLWMLVFCAITSICIFVFPEFWTQRGLSYRPEIWSGAIDIVVENFVFGVGYNEKLVLKFGDGMIAGHAHNLYLDVFVRSGVIGFSFLMLVVAFVCHRAIVRDKSEMPFVLILLFFLIGMLTDVQKLLNSPTEVYIMFWLPLTVLLSAKTALNQSDTGFW